MRTKMSVLVAGLGLLLAAVPVAAHHAFDSEFDAKKHVDFRGTVTKMEWIIPHAWIHVAVKKPDGTVDAWEVEDGHPQPLVRRGARANTCPPVDDAATFQHPASHGVHAHPDDGIAWQLARETGVALDRAAPCGRRAGRADGSAGARDDGERARGQRKQNVDLH